MLRKISKVYVNCMFRYIFLNFIDVPYQPVLHSNFTGGCSFINVTWSPPTLTARGGSVTGYLAEIYTAIAWDWINSIVLNNSKTTSCSFTQLEPNSKYRIRVKAKNKVGYGWPTEILEANTFQTGNLSQLLPVVLWIQRALRLCNWYWKELKWIIFESRCKDSDTFWDCFRSEPHPSFLW